jgi:phage shock protein C
MSERFYRSRTDRVLSGVAGGLAELWNLDPALVRVVWALLVPMTGGLALLAYIVMAFVVPEGPIATPGVSSAPPDEGAPSGGPALSAPTAPRPRRGSPGVVIGAALILIGAYLLVREYFPNVDLERFWPLLLVALGVVLLASAMGGGSRRAGPGP